MGRSVAAPIQDLKQRGLLDSPLVVWGGEFGRTPTRENRGGSYGQFAGRDHHPFGYTMWNQRLIGPTDEAHVVKALLA